MIDKLLFHTTQDSYSVAGKNKLIIQPAAQSQDESGKLVSGQEYVLFNNQVGSKAYCNEDRFQVTITGRGLSVQYSPAQLLTGNNIFSVGHGGVCASLGEITKQLKEIGIEVDIDKANLLRIDLFRNLALPEALGVYKAIFDIAGAKRSSKREYTEGYLWHNKSQQLCIYDKIKQCIAEGKPIPEDVINYLIRIEWRLLQGAKIRNTLPVSTGLHLQDRSRYDKLKIAYRAKVDEVLFKNKPSAIKPLANIQGAMSMSEKYTSKVLNELVQMHKIAGITKEQYSAGVKEDSLRQPNKKAQLQDYTRRMNRYSEALQRMAFVKPVDMKRRTEFYNAYLQAM